MQQENPLVDQTFVMQKFPGKGGWTYVEIPKFSEERRFPFGWVKVKGTIDDFKLINFKLMPMDKTRLLLPVKAAIRKVIGKQAGDAVKVVLYADDAPLGVPEELLLCFEHEPKSTNEAFQKLKEWEQKMFINWIYEAKTEDTKTNRIIQMMNKLSKNLGFYDKGY